MGCVASEGGAVLAAYLTDGSRSHPGSKAYPPAAVAKLREAEAREALDILGIRQVPLFFRLQDGALTDVATSVRAETVAGLVRALTVFRPDLVLAPWLRDPHPDHRAASEIAAEAAGALASGIPLEGYEVWLPIRGSRADHPQPGEATSREFRFDARALERKRRAILAHRSQTSRMIDDDPEGFSIDENLLQRWLALTERYHSMPARSPKR